MSRITKLCAILIVIGCVGVETSDDSAASEAAAGEAAMETTATPALPAAIAAAKAANEKYRDVTVALAEGYIEDPTGMCVMATDVGQPAEAGGMGLHYVSLQLLGTEMPPGDGPPPPGMRLSGTDATIDPMLPEVLVYEPTADGGRTLVAIEYLVFRQAWEAAGNTAPPSLAGHEFYYMEDDPATEMDEAHGFEPHYELHVWTHRPNETGLFSEFNPAVSCPDAMAGMQH